MTNIPDYKSPFASRSVAEHLLRGLLGGILVASAIGLVTAPTALRGLAAAAALVGGVVLLRGCPTCWAVGLADTIARTRRQKAA